MGAGPGSPSAHDGKRMQALFIGQTYIDVTFLTDHMPTGDEKHVASAFSVSFGGNAVTAAFCCAKLGIVPDPLARRRSSASVSNVEHDRLPRAACRWSSA